MKSIREKAVAFLERNPLPPNWSESLKRKLPSAGRIDSYIPLVFVKDTRESEGALLFSFTAHEVCTEERCTTHDLTPPDGTQVTWADVVPRLMAKMLLERIALQMLQNKLREIPESWEIQYEFSEHTMPVGSPT